MIYKYRIKTTQNKLQMPNQINSGLLRAVPRHGDVPHGWGRGEPQLLERQPRDQEQWMKYIHKCRQVASF